MNLLKVVVILLFLSLNAYGHECKCEHEEAVKIDEKESEYTFAVGVGFIGLNFWVHKNNFDYGLGYMSGQPMGVTSVFEVMTFFVNYHFDEEIEGWYIPFSVGGVVNLMDPYNEAHEDDFTGVGIGSGIGYKWDFGLLYLDARAKLLINTTYSPVLPAANIFVGLKY